MGGGVELPSIALRLIRNTPIDALLDSSVSVTTCEYLVSSGGFSASVRFRLELSMHLKQGFRKLNGFDASNIDSISAHAHAIGRSECRRCIRNRT
jgi:hypothetical protein